MFSGRDNESQKIREYEVMPGGCKETAEINRIDYRENFLNEVPPYTDIGKKVFNLAQMASSVQDCLIEKLIKLKGGAVSGGEGEIVVQEIKIKKR